MIIQWKMKGNFAICPGSESARMTVWADTDLSLKQLDEIRKMYPEEEYRVVKVQKEATK
jgi:hypothetical protein